MIYTPIRAYKRTSLDGGYLVSTEPGVPTQKSEFLAVGALEVPTILDR